MTIYGLLDLQFWIFGFLFLSAVFLFWFLPGWFFLRKAVPLSSLLLMIPGAIGVGLVFWTAIALILGWISTVFSGVRLFLLPSVLPLTLLGWKQFRFDLPVLKQGWKWNKKLFLLILVGLSIQLPAVFGSGLKTQKGVPFYFTNPGDGLMHLSFMEHMSMHFPPIRPEMSGLMLTNYHYFGDLATSELYRTLGIPLLHLFFQYLPVLLSVMIALQLFGLIRLLTQHELAPWFGLILWFFGGDMSYIFSWLLHQDFRWFSAAIDNGADQFLNPPQMFAKFIFAVGVWLLATAWSKKSARSFYLAVVLFASLIGFKIYFGMFALGALGIATIYRILTKKASSFELYGMCLAVILTLCIYLPTRGQSTHILWAPLIWPKLLISESHIFWLEWLLREQVYTQAGSWKGMLLLGVSAFFLGIFGIFGMRIFGIVQMFRKNRMELATTWMMFWLPATVLFIFLGLNTMQKPGTFNTFNFLIVSLFPLLIYTAQLLANAWKKNVLGKGFVILFVLLGTPRVIHNAVAYANDTLTHHTRFVFSLDEVAVLSWARTNTPKNAVLQTDPMNGNSLETAGVSYFSGRSTYVGGQGVLRAHEMSFEERDRLWREAFLEVNPLPALNRLGIDYLFVNAESYANLSSTTQIYIRDNNVFQRGDNFLVDVKR